MTTDRRMRASDQDRENAVESLCGAYAEGRLRPGEFYERIDAAYAAITWGELDSLTADLPLARADADLPADTVVTRGRRLLSPSVWVLVIVLAASVAGRTTSAAVWAACLLVPLALLLPSCCHSHRDAPERRSPPPDRDGRAGAVLCDSADYPALPARTGDPHICRDTIFIDGRAPR
ncbi:MAG: DUF1707 SHOCT-like domain-containing protein [Streptosporangiaceae bacterium]